MSKTRARRIPLIPFWIIACLPVFLAGCGDDSGGMTPTLPAGAKPSITIVDPQPNALVVLNDRIPINAIAFADAGVLRVELRVNDAVADTQLVYITARRYDYHSSWQFTSLGQHTLTLVAYDLNGAASDPVSRVVSVVDETQRATRLAPTPTETPFVIYVTATPVLPTRTFTATQTPRVIYVTATPRPTFTRTPKPAPTQTPKIILVTPTTSP